MTPGPHGGHEGAPWRLLWRSPEALRGPWRGLLRVYHRPAHAHALLQEGVHHRAPASHRAARRGRSPRGCGERSPRDQARPRRRHRLQGHPLAACRQAPLSPLQEGRHAVRAPAPRGDPVGPRHGRAPGRAAMLAPGSPGAAPGHQAQAPPAAALRAARLGQLGPRRGLPPQPVQLRHGGRRGSWHSHRPASRRPGRARRPPHQPRLQAHQD